MDEEHKERLKNWKIKADHVTNDHWVRFVIYWMIFDAYMSEESEEDRAGARLRWFVETDNELKTILRRYWEQEDYQEILERLKSYSPIKDMRPKHRDREEDQVVLNDISSDKELFGFIYQIRCNTFHGGKDLWDKDDNDLTRCVEMLFKKSLDEYLGIVR